MSFWKKILIDLVYVTLYYVMYKFLGFELTVIIALGQIVGSLTQKDFRKPQNNKQVYIKPTTRMRF